MSNWYLHAELPLRESGSMYLFLKRQPNIIVMSNFASLRSARQSKESNSYVKSNVQTQKLSTTTTQPSSNEGPVQVVHVLPPSVEVWLSNTHGRGLRTKTQHKPGICSLLNLFSATPRLTILRESGDILFSVKPHVATLSNQHLNIYCTNCFGSPSVASLKRCTSCKIVRYCSPVRLTCFCSKHLHIPPRHNRHAKTKIGHFTRENVLLCKSGPSKPRLPSSPFPTTQSDVWAGCYGRDRNAGLIVLGYFFLLLSHSDTLSPAELDEGD